MQIKSCLKYIEKFDAFTDKEKKLAKETLVHIDSLEAENARLKSEAVYLEGANDLLSTENKRLKEQLEKARKYKEPLKELADKQIDISPEFAKIMNENFFDLL